MALWNIRECQAFNERIGESGKKQIMNCHMRNYTNLKLLKETGRVDYKGSFITKDFSGPDKKLLNYIGKVQVSGGKLAQQQL